MGSRRVAEHRPPRCQAETELGCVLEPGRQAVPEKFSVDRYGYDQALDLAIQHREFMTAGALPD